MTKRNAQLLEKAYHELKEKAKAENEVVKQIYKQVTPTFAADDDSIWAGRSRLARRRPSSSWRGHAQSSIQAILAQGRSRRVGWPLAERRFQEMASI